MYYSSIKKRKYQFIGDIVPIYNAEYYLDDCINSVLALKKSNWQFILVDDGSKDLPADIYKNIVKSIPELYI